MSSLFSLNLRLILLFKSCISNSIFTGLKAAQGIDQLKIMNSPITR